MKPIFTKYVDRFHALKVRERFFIILTTAAAILVFSYVGIIEPQMHRQQAAQRQLAQQKTELADIQQKMMMAGKDMNERDVANRANLEKTKQEISKVNGRLTAITQTLVAPDRVAGLLEEMLKRNRGLQLVSLHNLPASDLIERKEAPVKERVDPAVAQAANILKRQGINILEKNPSDFSAIDGPLYKHGVEITVSGSYADLMAYLSELEKMPQRVLWNSAKLVVEEYPISRMTLTVYTLSLDKVWLTV